MPDCKKLRDPHLNVSSHPADGELARTLANVGNEEPVGGLEGLRRVLDGFCTCPISSANGKTRTLDLIAHANQARLLQLGSQVIDPRDDQVRGFFEQLAADRILAKLRVTELRLLGCETAMSRDGQAAIRILTELLGVRVVGTTKLLYAAYFGDKGLKDRYERMLRDATNLPDLGEERAEWPQDPLPALAPRLDVESLPAVELDDLPRVPWRRLGPVDDPRPLLDLIDGRDGRMMPRMLARPRCEILLGSRDGDRVRRIEILFEFELVRVPSADPGDGAIYRVKNPHDLARWVDRWAAA
jgi:catechol 2,3-dioxygenase-like lactoylglutathione lyase family enzyme